MTLASMDEACRLLGIEERRLKQLIRDRVLIEARGADGSRGIPRDVIVKGANGWEPLAVLQGTLTLLADDGFTSDESLEWLYTLQEELGERPIDALVSGRQPHRLHARLLGAAAHPGAATVAPSKRRGRGATSAVR